MSTENVATTPRPTTPPSPLTFSPLGSENLESVMVLSGVHSRAISRDSSSRRRTRTSTRDVLEQGSRMGHTPYSRLSRAHRHPRRQRGLDIRRLR
jgi:hypothetical protein